MKPNYERKKLLKYTVYDNRTDFPVCVCETAERCAELMGVSIGTFYRAVSGKRANTGRWVILKCEE